MTDAASLAAKPAEIAATNGAAQAPATRFDPAETQLFANMMQGVPTTPVSANTGPSALGDAAKAVAAQFSGNVRSYEEMRRSMLESIDLSDPVKTMFVLTDHSMQAHTMFAKLHISTGLASAATSLFGTLLKNQQ
ncbi:hypothetical protein [Caldimonas brevitalea]|uniref:Uncharacterized protein n=1 Tax=Caldimonas brevitalea TaxID=413882 RepID=A0A0G3BXI4_9BURK|nr:hypothetical protein [Caldimonas brevitalea]AKJ32081.1 hypothetical protein AAW51_5390 [Caldimonas brevitalea]